MQVDSVDCPICTRSVPETDINLHLDLQCPGRTHISSPAGGELARETPGKGNESAPTMSSPYTTTIKPGSELQDPTTMANESGGPPTRGAKRPSPVDGRNGTTGALEKKPRLNSLTANQP